MSREIMIFPLTEKDGYQHTPIYGRASDFQNGNVPDLIFETLHPDDPDNYFIFTFISPNGYMTKSSTRAELSPILFNRTLHQHDFFELMYVISGEVIQYIETEQHLYRAGSLCLLNRNVRHQERFDTEFRAVFLRLPVQFIENILKDMDDYYFDNEKLLQISALVKFLRSNIGHQISVDKEYIDFIPIKASGADPRYIYHLFEILTHQILEPQVGSSYFIKGAILQIFYELTMSGHYDNRPLNIGNDAESELFNSIRAVIHKRHGRISRKELETEMSYTGDYMNRIVKKYTGLSLQQYGMELCMRNAAYMLRSSSKTIAEICDELSITNRTYFYEHFKRLYGLTPKEYRRKYLDHV